MYGLYLFASKDEEMLTHSWLAGSNSEPLLFTATYLTKKTTIMKIIKGLSDIYLDY